MDLHPQAKGFLDQLVVNPFDKMDTMTPEIFRTAHGPIGQLGGSPEEVARVENRTIPGPRGPIPLRIYTPADITLPAPALVYFHGGCFVAGTLDMEDSPCRGLANAGICVVVAADYRLSPENKFPAAVDDAYAATSWVADNARDLGIDSGRIAVGGHSAGGNLAAVVAQLANGWGGPAVAFQLLVLPITDCSTVTPSRRENAKGYLLTKDMLDWSMRQYLRSDVDRKAPQCSPLLSEDLKGLPPALIITAEYDPLRDEGERYAEKLRQAGVAATVRRFEGAIHAFFILGGIMDQGKQAIQEAGAALRRAFGQP
jgi:acetyl esterase